MSKKPTNQTKKSYTRNEDGYIPASVLEEAKKTHNPDKKSTYRRKNKK